MLDCQVERVVVIIHLSQDLTVCVLHVHCTSKRVKETDQALSQVAILLTIFVVLTPANSFLPY